MLIFLKFNNVVFVDTLPHHHHPSSEPDTLPPQRQPGHLHQAVPGPSARRHQEEQIRHVSEGGGGGSVGK